MKTARTLWTQTLWLVALVILFWPRMLFGREPIPHGDEDEEVISISSFEKIPNWLWLSGQANFIAQMHPAFHALYSGEHSLRPEGETNARTRVLTLYTGLRLTRTTEVLFDIEETGGTGLSQAFGVAGNPNIDVVRNPSLTVDPYVARIMIHQIIPLSNTKIPAARSPLSLATSVPERRLELRAGKFSFIPFDAAAKGLKIFQDTVYGLAHYLILASRAVPEKRKMIIDGVGTKNGAQNWSRSHDLKNRYGCHPQRPYSSQ